jgi:hypothetical protein
MGLGEGDVFGGSNFLDDPNVYILLIWWHVTLKCLLFYRQSDKAGEQVAGLHKLLSSGESLSFR